MKTRRWRAFVSGVVGFRAELAYLLSVVACVIAVAAPAAGQDPNEGIRLMTFNIRYGAADDGPNSWPNRRELVADLIRREAPDVLAIQEGLAFQLEELAEALLGYRKLGQHRDGGLEGEFSGLYVRVESVEVLAWGEFWLSATPGTVRSVGWDAALPRMAVWADVSMPGDGNTLRVYGTHYDHRGARARAESSRLLLEHATAGPPAVFMGDFNAPEEAEPITLFLNRGFRSAVLVSDPNVEIGTFNGFLDAGGGRRIDHILVGPEFRIESAAILPAPDGGPWPSDHYPVTAVVRVG
jgi:endonuclease/exonuclease/phosphatase family metal-dependent hydrolase